jgi:hypothetical protein
MGTNDQENETMDYEQTLAYFHALHDARFKLLGFLPALPERHEAIERFRFGYGFKTTSPYP